ncbi:MAG: hypothetical protein KAT90_06640 [Gammaproteobacteria bacterium]|nr:hypothetical protein [Gammaproteobacteria bacterium]
MTKHQLNYSLLFALITAFLSMQWSATHIHLSEHHDHDNSQHQHDIEAHAHLLANFHADSIGSLQHADNSNVVELDQQCSTAAVKKITPGIAIIASTKLQQSLSQASSFELTDQLNNKLGYLSHSAARPRAPPHFS